MCTRFLNGGGGGGAGGVSPLPLRFHRSLPLRRLQQRLFLLPGLPSIPIMVGLIREGSSWLLVDAGAWDTPRRAHATDLVAALRAVIPAGDKLAAIARE
jgi:hypothetical protein